MELSSICSHINIFHQNEEYQTIMNLSQNSIFLENMRLPKTPFLTKLKYQHTFLVKISWSILDWYCIRYKWSSRWCKSKVYAPILPRGIFLLGIFRCLLGTTYKHNSYHSNTTIITCISSGNILFLRVPFAP